jgi:hypothetical protein
MQSLRCLDLHALCLHSASTFRIVIAQSLRNFLLALDGAAAALAHRARRSRGTSLLSNTAAARTRLLLSLSSLVMGLYFVSSVLLIRPRLPPRQRHVISAALGADVPFRFYEDFNDGVFIAAAAVSAAVLAAQHRAAGRADAAGGAGALAALPARLCGGGGGSASKRATD